MKNSNKVKKFISNVNKYFMQSSLILPVVLLFMTITVSYAWFANYFESNEIGFAAGTLDDNILEIAKVSTHYGTEEDRKYTECKDYKIEHESLPEVNGDNYKVDFTKFSYGVIDNVSMLKPENVVYFRLSIPKTNGNTVAVKFSYSDETFIDLYRNIYDENDNVIGQTQIVDENTIKNLQNIETYLDQSYLKYSAIMSNTKVEANELHTLAFTEYVDFNSGISFEFVNENIAAADDYYYVYIKVEPNLNVFSYSIEYISDIMPCYIYYKIKAEIEIH